MTTSDVVLARVGDAAAPRRAGPAAATMLDAELFEAQRTAAEAQRRVSTIAAAIADEIATARGAPGAAGSPRRAGSAAPRVSSRS